MSDTNLLPTSFDRDSIIRMIKESQNVTTQCDKNETVPHGLCFKKGCDNEIPVPQCPQALSLIIIELLALQPAIFDEVVRQEVANYYKNFGIKAKGLMSIDNLTVMNDKTKNSNLTWIKYEAFVSHLIKTHNYEPKTVANELLTIVKDEIPKKIASKVASVLETIVKHCREANKLNQDEEEEEKWCEIIDWLSWFIGSSDEL